MSPPLKFQSAQVHGRKERKAFVRLVPKALEAIDKELGETVEAIARGEVEVEDLAWEAELGGDTPSQKGP